MDKHRKKALLRSVVSMECYEKGIEVLNTSSQRPNKELSEFRVSYLEGISRDQLALDKEYQVATNALAVDKALLDDHSTLNLGHINSLISEAKRKVKVAYSNWRGSPIKLSADYFIQLTEAKETLAKYKRLRAVWLNYSTYKTDMEEATL